MGRSRHVMNENNVPFVRKMSTLSSANVTDVNLVLKERAHKLKMKYSMHQYSNSHAYFRQLANITELPNIHRGRDWMKRVTKLTSLVFSCTVY